MERKLKEKCEKCENIENMRKMSEQRKMWNKNLQKILNMPTIEYGLTLFLNFVNSKRPTFFTFLLETFKKSTCLLFFVQKRQKM